MCLCCSRTIVARVGYERDEADFEQELYLLFCTLQLFGLWASENKSARRGSYDCLTLGMVCDSTLQAFMLGNERLGYRKRDSFVALGRDIVATLEEEGYVSWASASRFGGKAISFKPAISVIRSVLNITYSILHQRVIKHGRTYADANRLSHISRREGDRLYLYSKEIERVYATEVQTCIRLALEGRVYPFTEERHVCICMVQTDATLKGYGCHLELTPEAKEAGLASPWGVGNEMAFGGLLPELVFGFHLGGSNSGICEFTGLFLSLAAIDANPELRRAFMNVFIQVELDNEECVIALNKMAVGGAGTLIKSELLLAVMSFGHKWQSMFKFRHVA